MAVPSKILNSLRLISCTILKPVLMFGEKIWGMAINIYHLELNNRRHYFYAVDGFKCFTWSCRFSNVQVLWFCMQENDPLCKRICYRVFFPFLKFPLPVCFGQMYIVHTLQCIFSLLLIPLRCFTHIRRQCWYWAAPVGCVYNASGVCRL